MYFFIYKKTINDDSNIWRNDEGNLQILKSPERLGRY